METVRITARSTLIDVLSCRRGTSDSGVVSRVAGDAIGADGRWCADQPMSGARSLMGLLIWLLLSMLGNERISGVHRQAFG